MMSWRWMVLGACAGLLCLPTRGSAQSAARSFVPSKEKPEQRVVVPKGYMPPAGMCRIWLEDVPPAQQPAPTDCATAIKNRPTKGRVVFGDDGAQRSRAKDDKDGEKAKARKP
jgi:hypothetical protein